MTIARWRIRGSPGGAFAVGLVGLVLFVSAFWVRVGRPEFFYLADAFLHGRTWLDSTFGIYDFVQQGARFYVPFAPFPALGLAPLVALVGPAVAAASEPVVNVGLAMTSLALLWRLADRFGVARTADRVWLVVLFGLSTATWWITMLGGVWHTGQLFASVLTFAGLLEAHGRRRPLVLGLLGGAAFLSRATLVAAFPYWAWRSLPDGGRTQLTDAAQRLALLTVGAAPAFLFALWYNAARFGSPLESGYALATLPPFLDALRAEGLFSVRHLPMNLQYLLLEVPGLVPRFPWIAPDGFGMSILLTSPGLLLAARADWRRRETVVLGLSALLVLIPSLLYYGGGWFQYGYRYALDAIPLVMMTCALGAARAGISLRWQIAIVFGVAVNLLGVLWYYFR
ncbi:MAG TPA: hypothetical protein VIK13_11315 [Candidatus Limnocylindrales bacterium]